MKAYQTYTGRTARTTHPYSERLHVNLNQNNTTVEETAVQTRKGHTSQCQTAIKHGSPQHAIITQVSPFIAPVQARHCGRVSRKLENWHACLRRDITTEKDKMRSISTLSRTRNASVRQFWNTGLPNCSPKITDAIHPSRYYTYKTYTSVTLTLAKTRTPIPGAC